MDPAEDAIPIILIGVGGVGKTLIAVADEQLARDWERQQASMIWMQHNENPPGTIELSLASPFSQDPAPMRERFWEWLPSFAG